VPVARLEAGRASIMDPGSPVTADAATHGTLHTDAGGDTR
jgi:hypothetical protein